MPEKLSSEEKKKCIFQKFDRAEVFELVNVVERENGVSRRTSEHVFESADMDHNCDRREIFWKYMKIYIRYLLPKRKRIPLIARSVPDGLYEESYSCWPPAIGIFIFTILELTCFIVDEASRTKYPSERKTLGPTAELFIYDPYQRYQVYRYLTYMFVHVGYMHLVVNLVVQLLLGVPLEMVHKGGRVLAVYFSGVIAGSLGTSMTAPKVFLAGASGGVYALITGHIGTILMNWKEMEVPGIQLMIFLIIIGADVGTSLYNSYILQMDENVGYAAHLFGAVAGLLVGIWNLKNFVPKGKETHVWWCALTIYIVFMGTMILLNIFWTDHFASK